ncbi:hypothetical protein ACET3Z_004922 [Daucus carota]
MYVVDEKAPEVHMNPFTIFNKTKSAENSDKFGTLNLEKTSMGVPGPKFILKQILSSPISSERILVVQKLHSIIVHKERSRDRHKAVLVGQEAGEIGSENVSETEATVNTSVTEATVNNPEFTVSEAVVSRTEDAIMESTGNEAAITTGGTENHEDEMPSMVLKSRRKTFRELIQEKGAHRTERLKGFRCKRKPKLLMKKVHAKTDAMPIQGIFGNSFDSMKKHMTKQILEVGIKYDKAENFLCYTPHHPATDGHVNQTKFDKDFKNHRGNHTRSIYFFELLRMIEILEDDDTVTPELLEPNYEYYNLRERKYREVYGDWRFHDDADYLSPVEEDQAEATADEVINLTADDEDDQPSHSTQGNPSEAQQQRYSTSSY